MKKLITFMFMASAALQMFAQPDQWAVAIDPSSVNQLLGSERRQWEALMTTTPVTIDGTKDAVWDKVEPQQYDRFIKEYTKNNSGTFQKISMLNDGDNNRRLPDNDADFKGYWRVLYDEDYFYMFFDITDNEVNDGTINTFSEVLEIQEATYADSAQQALNGNPYPPYTGAAGELNKKFCYWGYLGSFQLVFSLAADNKCNFSFRQKSDALTKINYDSRAAACNCAWKIKPDGSGYIAEAAMSLKITFADSAGTPFTLPAPGDARWFALEMKVIDKDLNMKDIQASWNAVDNNVWDAMIYAGKVMLKGWSPGIKDAGSESISFWPNPAVSEIQFSAQLDKVQVIDMKGIVVKEGTNTNILNVSELPQGMYIIRSNDKILGKMTK